MFESCFSWYRSSNRHDDRSLAEVEMRLIFARLLWNFDLELVKGQEDWMKTQPATLLWEKGPLMVNLRARKE